MNIQIFGKRNAIAYGAYIIISIPPPSGGTNSNESVLRLQVFVLQLTQLLRHPGINIRCTHPFTVDVQVRLFS